tara:strand:- start:234 stop:647 length:414 start_codon:yes stop_codon:yes gene_type:complete
MKITSAQLKKIIETVLLEEEEEADETEKLQDLTVEDSESQVKAVLTHIKGDQFKLTINDKEFNDPKKIADVVTKAYLDLADYTAKNPEDKSYRTNLTKIIEKTIQGGVEGLKNAKASRLVNWNSIVQKLGRGKDRNK